MKTAKEARADYIAWHRAQLKAGPWEIPAGSNKNPYSKTLGNGPAAWCVDYAVAGLEATGSGGGIIPTRSTLAHINWAKTVGRHRGRMRPALGALAGVAKNGTSVHTDACVINASTSKLVAIGGNTSNRGGSTADGGGVYANDRTYMLGSGAYRIYGYTVPFFGLSREDVGDIQSALGVKRTRYMTAETVAAVKTFQKSKGLSVDGFPGPSTFAVLGGGIVADVIPALPTLLVEDGVFGDASARALQGRLGVTADGRIGPDTIRAWQVHEGTPVDGLITGQPAGIYDAFPSIRRDCIRVEQGSSRLIATVQRNVGVTADGRAGRDTARAMQAAINRDKGAFAVRRA